MKQLILVRHGETLHNVAGIAQGWNDSDLSDEGREQVRRLAERLLPFAPTAIYSSPLGRALSTAQAIADATGLPIATLDDLREMNYGRWEGRSFLEVRQESEDVYRRWISDETCPCPDGESHADVRARLERALGAIDSERPVLVTHGTAIRIAATVLLKLPVMAAHHFAQDNTGMNVFVRRQDRWVLKAWNQT